MRRFLALAIAASAVAVVPVPTANAAAANTCNGVKTQITGSGKAEKFTLTQRKLVINAHGGDDVIEADLPPRQHLAFPATVCMGSGNDILRAKTADAVAVRYLDGGKGFDTAEIYVCFDESNIFPKIQIKDIERLTIVNCQD
jgi:hypothetical protein